MPVSKSAWLAIGVVAGFASGAASFAIAQATQKEVLTTLENNQGILVDKNTRLICQGITGKEELPGQLERLLHEIGLTPDAPASEPRRKRAVKVRPLVLSSSFIDLAHIRE